MLVFNVLCRGVLRTLTLAQWLLLLGRNSMSLSSSSQFLCLFSMQFNGAAF